MTTNFDAVKEKIAKAQAQLEAQLEALQTSDDWKRALEAIAHYGPAAVTRYSFGNVLLLMAQHGPTAHVATFRRWQALGRNVKKGEKALMVLRPRIVRTARKNAAGETEEAKKLAGFSYLSVFAIEQTEGEPLPELPRPRVIDTPQDFEHSVASLRKLVSHVDGVAGIVLRPRVNGDHRHAGGWYNLHTHQIVVITGETSEAQIFKTLLHEVAHAVLHGNGDHHSVPVMEVEAESTAYVVAHALQLDTSSYSLPYVAGWASATDEKPTKVVARVGERIRKAAGIILEAVLPEAKRERDEEAKPDADRALLSSAA